MIVYAKGAHDDEIESGYLALRLRIDGVWVPVEEGTYKTSKAAKQACAADLGRQLVGLGELLSARLQLLAESVMRLNDRPSASDQIRVRRQICAIDRNRSITIPNWPKAELSIEIEEPLFRELRRIMLLKERPREQAVRAILDVVQNQPLEIIAAVDSKAPGLLGAVMELMVEVCRRLDIEPDWETGIKGSDEAAETAAAIDDSASSEAPPMSSDEPDDGGSA